MPLRVTSRVDERSVQRAIQALARLDRKLARKTLRKAVNEGAKIVREAAKQKVHDRTGQLRKSIGVRVKVYRASGTVVAVVGPRKGFRKEFPGYGVVDPINYAHLVEYGRRAVRVGTTSRNGRRTGSTSARILTDGANFFGESVRSAAPKPFMRPAFDENRDLVIGLMLRIIRDEIERTRA